MIRIAMVIGIIFLSWILASCASKSPEPTTPAATDAPAATATPTVQAVPPGQVLGELVDINGNVINHTGIGSEGQMMRSIWLCDSEKIPETLEASYFSVNDTFYTLAKSADVTCIIYAVDMNKVPMAYKFYAVEPGQYFIFFKHEVPASGFSRLMDANGEDIALTLTADQGIDLGQTRITFP